MSEDLNDKIRELRHRGLVLKHQTIEPIAQAQLNALAQNTFNQVLTIIDGSECLTILRESQAADYQVVTQRAIIPTPNVPKLVHPDEAFLVVAKNNTDAIETPTSITVTTSTNIAALKMALTTRGISFIFNDDGGITFNFNGRYIAGGGRLQFKDEADQIIYGLGYQHVKHAETADGRGWYNKDHL